MARARGRGGSRKSASVLLIESSARWPVSSNRRGAWPSWRHPAAARSRLQRTASPVQSTATQEGWTSSRVRYRRTRRQRPIHTMTSEPAGVTRGRRATNLLAAAGFWVFVSIVYAGQIWWLARLPGERINVRQALTWQTTYFLLWIPLTLVVWRATASWLPESSGGWTRMLLRHAPIFAAAAGAHFILVAAVSQMLGAQRDAFWPSVLMQATGRLHLELLIYTAVAGSGAALVLHQRYRDRELAAARLQAELAAARLDALQGHLQPHFLFNSLHSIASLARAGDNAGVVRLIAGFSEILRHLLSTEARHLPLREELALVERYLEIQRVRFADRLQVAIDLAPDT